MSPIDDELCEEWKADGHRIVETLRILGIRQAAVLSAMESVPRALFLPAHLRDRAAEDGALPIGRGQTISQPFIVALMAEAVLESPRRNALEVGTGSGYSAAILAHICDRVLSVERIPEFVPAARERLDALGIRNVDVRLADGSAGVPECAPFDVISVTAAAPRVPSPLLAQLAPGGRLVLPTGERDGDQLLSVWSRAADGSVVREDLCPVRFVPLIGRGAFAGDETDGEADRSS